MGNDGTWWRWWKWCPTSAEQLKQAEDKLLEGIRTVKSYFVTISHENKLRTIETENESDNLPLVMLHGFGAGVGLWIMNIAALSEKRKVYALDLIGFGRSSRPKIPCEGMQAEEYFVQSIEEWREEVGLEKFILLGHSFGGYLASSYTIQYPQRVKHLVLADPWGMAERTPEAEERFEIPSWGKGIYKTYLALFNPLAALRFTGPLGPYIIRIARPDLKRKFSKMFDADDTRVVDYLYHVNAQAPSAEPAFMSLIIPYGWAKYPINLRMKDIPAEIPISILFGSLSWMDVESGHKIKDIRSASYVYFRILEGGHHVYGDNPEEFNREVNEICDRVDSGLDIFSYQSRNYEADNFHTLDKSRTFGRFLKPV